jgi:sugar lactone lactonase YvrE
MTLTRTLLLALLFVPLLPGEARPQGQEGRSRFVVDASWPQKPDEFTWGAVPGIAVDAEDQVYVFNRNQPAVQVYRADGTLVRSWNTANPNGAHHVRLDPEGNVWLSDFRNHVVQKYSPEGTLLLTLGEAGRSGSDEHHFNGPTDKAFLPNGHVYIADGYGNRRVIHFDDRGRFVRQWGEDGTGPGQFALPHAIAIDSQGQIYVADRNNARIQVFDTAGKLLAVWDDLIVPWGLVVTGDDHLWVCGSSRVRQPDGDGWVIAPPPDQSVMKLNRDGEILLHVPLDYTATPPGKPGEVDWVHGIAVDSQGNLYLSDIQGKRAQKFTLHKP